QLVYQCIVILLSVIQTQQTVLAAEGEDAPLSCQLLETEEVHQVTWQKVSESTERTISSYSNDIGPTVNPDFKDKVQFTEAGLQNSSIVIRNVTEQDEGYYLCRFKFYPDGLTTIIPYLNMFAIFNALIMIKRLSVLINLYVKCVFLCSL
uniref:Ig-like domain-containing protein n=1 Tax=Cyprinodon variegatus TaxID=28743 RepID=A0A3Q2DLF0_CYPVA